MEDLGTVEGDTEVVRALLSITGLSGGHTPKYFRAEQLAELAMSRATPVRSEVLDTL